MSNAVHNRASIRDIQRMTFKGKKNTAHFDEKIIWQKKPANITVQESGSDAHYNQVYLVRFPKGRAIRVHIDYRLTSKLVGYNEDFALFYDDDFAYSVALFAKKKGWKHIKFTSDLNFSPLLNTETQNSLIVTPKPFVYGTGFQTKVYSEETVNAWWIGVSWTTFPKNLY